LELETERMKPSKLRISTKVALLFVGLILLQGAGILVSLTTVISRTQNEAFRTQMARTMMGIDAYLEAVLDEQTIQADLLSGQAKIIDYTDYGLQNLLRHELSIYRHSLQMSSVAIYREPGGAPFARVGEDPEALGIPSERIEDAFRGEETFRLSSDARQAMLTAFAPIEREGVTIGVVGVGRRLDERFVDRLQSFTHTTIVLSVGEYAVAVDELDARTIRRLSEMTERERRLDGVGVIGDYVVGTVSMAGLGEPDARVYVLLDTSQERRLLSRYNMLSVSLTSLVIVLALLMALVFYRVTFNRPFQDLLSGVHKIAEGDFEHDVRAPSDDEFGELAWAFNRMRVNIVARERELLQLSLYNALILDNVPSGIITASLEREVTTFNSAATRILGIDGQSVVATELSESDLPRGLLELIEEGLTRDRYENGQELRVTRNGGVVILSVTTSPLLSKEGEKIGTIGIFQDVTKVRQLEERLAVSKRLAALGEMAAGVAHQMRNPLGVMKVSAQMLRDDFDVNRNAENFHRITHMIVNEIDTLNLVIRNLLDFARPREAQMEPCSVRQVVESALENLPLDRYPELDIEFVGLDDVPPHPMDRTLMEQVVSNLTLNAMEASPPDAAVRIQAGMENGQLYIEVRDWGEGFSEPARGQIFDPFFTTKPKGTGLGLSIAHQIVEQHSGRIEVFSEPGEGAAFRVVL